MNEELLSSCVRVFLVGNDEWITDLSSQACLPAYDGEIPFAY